LPRRFLRWLPAAIAAAVALTAAGPAAADIAPPWCGTPEPDAAGNLPATGTGNFAHIPYYAIKCTLDRIQSQSLDGRMTVKQIGVSAGGRPMYSIVINQLKTGAQKQAFFRWQHLRADALTDPAAGQAALASYGDDVKVPLFIQAGIHGNETEGVDSSMRQIERLATTPYGADPEVDRILDGAIVIFNIDQNPDGRALGQRANGNNFDLNRDVLTQSQSETKASVGLMQDWLPPDILDQHGYVTPTLVEATTKPHNPGIDYDLWLKWNQSRIDANEAALATVNLGLTRPVNDWCADGNPAPQSGICPGGGPPGPAVAEGWDDWGPFYTPMYSQLVGLNGSTVEMCSSTSTSTNPGNRCYLEDRGAGNNPVGRLASLLAQYTVAWSTLLYDVSKRNELLHDQLEIYRRGVTGAPRPACCPPPFDVANNWMYEFPTAYVIPVGKGQRADTEANRLAEWLIFNGIQVRKLRADTVVAGQTVEQGSYVVDMKQAHRGLAETALGIGVDVSSQIGILYAPPAAWSHGYLWGADIVQVPRGVAFTGPVTAPINKPTKLDGGLESGLAEYYALAINSPTAVRTLNTLLGKGLTAKLATAQFTTPGGRTFPAGTVLFPFDPATKLTLGDAAREAGLLLRRVHGTALSLEPVDRSPRIAVLTGAVDQSVWSLRNLGFTADPVSTGLINTAATDPLASYDVIFNTSSGFPANTPANTTGRARLAAFFANGGGYIGGGTTGASFLTNGGIVTGLTAGSRGGNGRSGIVYWNNAGGVNSPITGAYPAQDTAIMDPPTWLTGIPAGWTVDANLPLSGFFAAGLWLLDSQAAAAPGAPIIAHGTSTAGAARLAAFAPNPLYRADPEREWPALTSAALWADQ
jgi:Zinc carboxypeptidase